jgi:hypothetical protein
MCELFIRILCGGMESDDEKALCGAFDDLCWENVVVEKLHIHQIRENRMTPSDVVDWLEYSHIHIILAYINEGAEVLEWNVEDLEFQLQRLRDHVGFPMGIGLMDPIILQDKYRYISAVPGLTHPTMKLEISSNGDVSLDVATEIDRFYHNWFIRINSNFSFSFMTQYEGRSRLWIMKAPYCSNKRFFQRTVSSGAAVIAHMRTVARHITEDGKCLKIPYMMLQPALTNRKEYKVILHDGVAQYISSVNSQHGHAFNKEGLLPFAEHALAKLRQACPEGMINANGMVRVDIMERDEPLNGVSFVVNEFESLTARFNGKHESETMGFLRDYWREQLQHFYALAV